MPPATTGCAPFNPVLPQPAAASTRCCLNPAMAQIGTQSVTTGGPGSPDAMPQRRLIGPVGTGPARNRPRSSASTAIELLLTAARAALACADPQTALLRGGAARRLFRTQRRPWWYQQATF